MLDPNAESDDMLDPNAESDEEYDSSAKNEEILADPCEGDKLNHEEQKEDTVISMFEKKKLLVEKSKQMIASYESMAIEFLEIGKITVDTDFDDFDNLVKEKLKARLPISRKQKEECFKNAVKSFKSIKKDKIKRNFMKYLQRIAPEGDIEEDTKYKSYKAALKDNSKLLNIQFL